MGHAEKQAEDKAMTYTAEQLEKWRRAGVLFEFSSDGKSWSAPMILDRTSPEVSEPLYWLNYASLCCYKQSTWWAFIRPHRAPGRVQPHDGSPERPQWVAEDARVAVGYPTFWHETGAEFADWGAVDFFIVLPDLNHAAAGQVE